MRLRFLILLLAITLFTPAFAQAPSDAELQALNEWSVALYQSGRYTEAIPLAESYLAATRVPFEESARKHAIALSNLARLLQATHRLSEAEALYRNALAIDEASFGKGQSNVATAPKHAALLKTAEADPGRTPNTPQVSHQRRHRLSKSLRGSKKTRAMRWHCGL
jgi:tetratricopeptide (TPR) repeat protein